MTHGLTYSELQEKVVDLESRVEGLETMLADAVLGGRLSLALAADHASVEPDRQHPSPAWERD